MQMWLVAFQNVTENRRHSRFKHREGESSSVNQPWTSVYFLDQKSVSPGRIPDGPIAEIDQLIEYYHYAKFGAFTKVHNLYPVSGPLCTKFASIFRLLGVWEA